MAFLQAQLYSHILKRNMELLILLPDEYDEHTLRMVTLVGHGSCSDPWQRFAFAKQQNDPSTVYVIPDDCSLTDESVRNAYLSSELPAAVRRLLPGLTLTEGGIETCR